MLCEIIRKEILENVKSPKFVFTFLLCTILILLSVYTGVNNYRAELREYNAGIALNRKNLNDIKSYSALRSWGMKITKPPEVLGTIVTGIGEAFGRRATIGNWEDTELVDSKYESNPVSAIFHALDLVLIVKIVLSLFAILFTFDAITGEKEQGTLRLAFSNNLPRDKLILGKVIGGFISLMLPLIIPILLSLIIFFMYPDVSFSGEDWIRVGLIFILFFLYLSVFFMLGLFISSRTQSSANSLFILLFIWVMFIFIIPKASVVTAKKISPIPSAYEVTAQKYAVLVEVQISARKRIDEKSKERNKMSSQEWQAFLGEITQDLTEQEEAKYAKINEEYRTKQRKQEVLAENLSRISPASALMFGTMSLGRTGINEHKLYASSIRNYKSIFTGWINAKYYEDRITYFANRKPSPEADLSDMPQHEFKQETLSNSFARTIPDFLLMIFTIILFFTGAFVSFLRYDVR